MDLKNNEHKHITPKQAERFKFDVYDPSQQIEFMNQVNSCPTNKCHEILHEILASDEKPKNIDLM